ncbi:4348_t:CDS:1, partial [Entrophospora sp. SA101]
TKYAAWVNQYGWAVYDAGMDILATHNLGTNSRRYKDLYNLRDIIHTGNLAPNVFCAPPNYHAFVRNA